MKRVLGFLFGLLATFWMAAPAAAWNTLNDSEQPGSVLVFPKFVRGTFADFATGAQLVQAVTELEISVTCPPGSTCAAEDQAVFLKARWVCPNCTESSFNLDTTVNGTLYFNPEGVTVVPGLPGVPPVITAKAFPSNVTTPILPPPCKAGYLIVWVVDANGHPIKFDGLIGDAIIRDPITSTFAGTGVQCDPDFDCAARGYNAIPIQADPALSKLQYTDLNSAGQHTGALAFDGSGHHYKAVTGKIYGTVRYEDNLAADANVQTDLTLLTLDATLNIFNPVTTVELDFFTPDEENVDTFTAFTCWEEKRLTDINPNLTVQNMGRKGLVTSISAKQQTSFSTTVPVTLLGLVETLEFDLDGFELRDYSYLLYNDSKPLATTFVP
jgi:hypothetical protein